MGIMQNKKALLSLVCSEESKDMVISVIGDAGSGKTTLIREVYQMIKKILIAMLRFPSYPLVRTC